MAVLQAQGRVVVEQQHKAAMETRQLLMVFIKNPVPGKVKTRLASSIGEAQALTVYNKLLDHTLNTSRSLPVDKVVYYSDFIPADDVWRTSGFSQELQQGDDLGERMMNAFIKAFQQHYEQVAIIGSDCFDLTKSILTNAFDELNKKDVVVGPALDGGYYLLGMKSLHQKLFLNKTWSTEKVLNDTLENIHELNLSFYLLPLLRDIDTEQDLKASSVLIKSGL
jgi:rSAM/selenodomain-associated transferase 1